jgi:hypothetical protein
MRLLTMAAICLAAVSLAHAAEHPQCQGTWAATAGAAAFVGTWNAVPGAAPDTAGGSWSLRDPNGVELATGTWAAGKQGRVWKGTWQARRPSGQVYDGAWSAQVELPAAAHFSSLFEAAITNAVSGSWRTGTLAGAWTIRAYAQ